MSGTYGTFVGSENSSSYFQTSKNRLSSKNIIQVSAVLILSVFAVCALISQERGLSPEVKVEKDGSIVTGQLPLKQRSLRSQVLEDEEPAPAAAEESAKFAIEDLNMENFNAIFGWHGTFAVIVLIGSIALWVHLRFIRPQTWFREWQKTFGSAADGFGEQKDSEAYLDENDITGSLTLVPGEAVFFNEEVALSFGGVFGSCSKMSVTNLRIIAQKTDTTLCGTCMLGAHEDAWPIANVSKVRLATGEFYGLTVPNLIFYTWFYFGLTLSFDLIQFFVLSYSKTVIESMVPLLDVRIVLTVLSCIGNILVAFALLYAVGTAVLLIWPHTLLKVYLTRKMEEKSQMFPFSTPMESFTFQTNHAYKAYQAIFAAQSKAGTGGQLQGGAFNEIPASIYTKKTATFVAAPGTTSGDK